MVEPTSENAVNSSEENDKKFHALMESYMHDEKNAALEKYPELRAVYKAQETYEIYFLKGATDEIGLVELKKKIGKKIIGELIYGNS